MNKFISLTAIPLVSLTGLRGRALTGRRPFGLASLRSVCGGIRDCLSVLLTTDRREAGH